MGGSKELQKSIHELSKTDTFATERRSFTAESIGLFKDFDREVTGKKNVNPNKIVIKEPQKILPADKIGRIPQTTENKKNEALEEIRKVYSDEEMNLRLKAIGDAGYEVPQTPDDLAKIRAGKMDQVKVTDKNGIEKTEFIWQENVPQDIRNHYDWLREYFYYTDPTREEYRQTGNVRLIDSPKKASVNGPEIIYEHQTGYNCYCCAGTAMLNQFIRNSKKETEPVRYFNQNQLRDYRPQVKKLNPVYEKQGLISAAQHRQIAGEINKYAGRGTGEYGNIFEMGDFFIEKLEGSAILNKMYFQRPQNIGNAVHNMRTVFKNKIQEVLSTGNVLSFLEVEKDYGHYLTITGINGDDITILNSMNPEGQTQEVKSVDQLLERLFRSGNPVELAWLSKMKEPKDLQKEYTNLKYDEKNGYSLIRPNQEGVADISHTKGLAVKKELDDMGPGMESITEVAYIPNPLAKVETQPLDDAVGKNAPVEKINSDRSLKEEELNSPEKRIYTEEELKEKEEISKKIKNYYAEKDKAKKAKGPEGEEEKENRELSELKYEAVNAVTRKKEAGSAEEKEAAKELVKAAKKKVRSYEKKNKDYRSFGVAFSADGAKVNAADSSLMSAVKNSLADYLKIRSSIFEKYKLLEMTTGEQIDQIMENRTYIVRNASNVEKISDDDRQLMGDAYERVKYAADQYIKERSFLFKFGRGSSRLKQVKELKKRLQADNIRFYLSSERRMLLNSVDEKYEKDNAGLRQNLMPTWKKFIKLKDEVELKNKLYRENRLIQQARGETPSLSVRIGEWNYRALENTWLRTKMVYNGIGGTIDRTLGFATMLAANTLELGGKIVKAPLTLISMMFNKVASLAGWRARWNMKYSLGEGWKGIDDGRKIFRKYLKGACILPAFVTESLTRGIPYIFGHHFKSGVYKRTKRWSGAILEDIKNVGKSLGIKNYGAMDRGEAEYNEIPGHREEKGKLIKYTQDGNWEDSDGSMEEESSQWEEESEISSEYDEEENAEIKTEKKRAEVPAVWTFKGNTVTASDFKERKLDKLSKARENLRASKEQAGQMLGEDDIITRVNAGLDNIAGDYLSKSFGDRQPETGELTGMVNAALRELKGKTASGKEAQKRTDEALEKITLRNHLIGELEKLKSRRESERSYAEECITASAAEKSTEMYKTDAEKEALRLWAFGKNNRPDECNFEGLSNKDKDTVVYYALLKSFSDIRIEDFIDKNEAEAASKFAERYETVCRLASAEVLFNKYEAGIQGQEAGMELPAAEIRGKVEFFKELKLQYENRIKLMTSPFFVLLRNADMNAYLESSGEKKAEKIADDKLREYVQLYIATMRSPLAFGKNCKKYYEEKIKASRASRAKEDEKRVAPAIKELEELEKNPVSLDKLSMRFPEIERPAIEPQPDDSGTETEVQKLYRAKKQQILNSFMPGHPGHLDKYPPFSEKQVMGMNKAEQYEMEKLIVKDVYCWDRINGQNIKEEHRAVLSKLVDECMLIRREFLAVSKTNLFLEAVVNGEFSDMRNKDFLQTAAGKKLSRYYLKDGLPMKYRELEARICLKYGEALNQVFVQLHDFGYTIQEKYERRIKEEADRVLEADRKKYEERLNNESEKKGEKEKRWDYPVVTVNGRQFTLYTFIQQDTLDQLKNRTFMVDDDKAGQLMKDMEDLSEVLRTLSTVYSLYSWEEGIKHFVYSFYHKSCENKYERLLDSIGKTLNLKR